MTIIEKIKNGIEPIVGAGRFHYEDQGDLSVVLDRSLYPCAFMSLVAIGTLPDSLGAYHEQIRVEMIFADLTAEGLDSLKNEEIIDRQKRKACAWLSSLYRGDDFEIVGEVQTSRYYLNDREMHDAFATAYAVTVSLREVEGIGPCSL